MWEQEFAWTEVDKPVMVAARALTVPDDHKLNEQPIFCFETMMHMLYWSSIVYDYKRVRCCTKAIYWNCLSLPGWAGLCCAVLCCAVLCCTAHVIDCVQ